MSEINDTRQEVEIDLDNEDWFQLMKMAHERDITLNQMVEHVLREQIALLENAKK
jgi:hypothetical protein